MLAGKISYVREHFELDSQIGELVGSQVVSKSPVSGGDFATAFRVELSDGRVVFAKTHADPPPGFFSTEAAGLRWLAQTEQANVAEVIAVTDDAPALLVLNWIDQGGRRAPQTEAEFGSQLAALHAAGAECFGRTDGRTTGSQALPNDPCDSWAEFYADRRLHPLASIAAARNSLPNETIDELLSVASRLAEFGAADEAPARLHGDLWAGNRMVDQTGRSWLIDPAAHGGHREFDLAMMQLFGGFGEQCFAAYQEATPLTHGWQARVPLHQLAPLVVHAIKFGGGYANGVRSALAALSRVG